MYHVLTLLFLFDYHVLSTSHEKKFISATSERSAFTVLFCLVVLNNF